MQAVVGLKLGILEMRVGFTTQKITITLMQGQHTIKQGISIIFEDEIIKL